MYENLKPRYSFNLLADLAMVIYDFDYSFDECVIAGFVSSSKKDTPTKLKMYTTIKGEAYFNKNGKRYYIRNFMRMD
jgi:hypothetical protein